MPHISVKLFEGRSNATKLVLAKALQAELARVLGGGNGTYHRFCGGL